jgi:hypothetical protein
MNSPSGKNRSGTPEGVLPPPIPSPEAVEGQGGGSAASQGAELANLRLSAFRFLFLYYSHLGLSETKPGSAK